MPFLFLNINQFDQTTFLALILNDIDIERCGWTQKLIQHLLQNCDICFKDSVRSQQNRVKVAAPN